MIFHDRIPRDLWPAGRVPRVLLGLAVCLLLFGGQSRPCDSQTPPKTIQALFVSDIHFEPFWDPGKVPSLAAAPVTGWKKILDTPDSPNRQQAFDALQSTCKTRGTDTSYPLLRSSLTAIEEHASGAVFITLSGDLMAHGFDCKYKTLLPHASADAYRSFTLKTIRFVLSQLEAAAPGVPVYAALGNNDSACGDYKLDANSAFLKGVASAVVQRFPAKERANALASFSQSGSYSVVLPAPMESTRLIVLDDLFFSAKHTSCSGKPDPAAQDALYSWLATQLQAAQAAHQKVWVMAHIAPGVDAYATLAHVTGPCGRAPTMLLSSNKLTETMMGGADVIKLAVFGHTHEDEIKLLQSPSGPHQSQSGQLQSDQSQSDQSQSDAKAIPVKLVASISPVNGNLPSFTVAEIDPATATLMNYQVITGSDKVAWHLQYDYRAAYDESSFSADSVKDLVEKFSGDHDSKSQASQSYIHNFSIGNPVPLLSLVWPGYVCTMTHQTAKGFTDCACSQRLGESGN